MTAVVKQMIKLTWQSQLHKLCVFLQVQSYLLEAAITEKTPKFWNHSSADRSSGNKMLEESQNCFEGSLVI